MIRFGSLEPFLNILKYIWVKSILSYRVSGRKEKIPSKDGGRGNVVYAVVYKRKRSP